MFCANDMLRFCIATAVVTSSGCTSFQRYASESADGQIRKATVGRPMLLPQFVLHLLLISLLSGCTTMKAVEGVGNDISKGNIFMGTLGILAVPGAMIIDVFTLGGTLSTQEAAGAWGAGINTYASNVNSNGSEQSAPSGKSQSLGGCTKIKGDPSCYVGACNKSGGKAVVKRNNLGCGMVYCNYPDGKNNSAHVYDYLPGSGCAGSVK